MTTTVDRNINDFNQYIFQDDETVSPPRVRALREEAYRQADKILKLVDNQRVNHQPFVEEEKKMSDDDMSSQLDAQESGFSKYYTPNHEPQSSQPHSSEIHMPPTIQTNAKGNQVDPPAPHIVEDDAGPPVGLLGILNDPDAEDLENDNLQLDIMQLTTSAKRQEVDATSSSPFPSDSGEIIEDEPAAPPAIISSLSLGRFDISNLEEAAAPFPYPEGHTENSSVLSSVGAHSVVSDYRRATRTQIDPVASSDSYVQSKSSPEAPECTQELEELCDANNEPGKVDNNNTSRCCNFNECSAVAKISMIMGLMLCILAAILVALYFMNHDGDSIDPSSESNNDDEFWKAYQVYMRNRPTPSPV